MKSKPIDSERIRSENPRKFRFIYRFREAGFITAAAFIFAASFPGFLFPAGFPVLAYVALVPVFLAIRGSSWLWLEVYALLYGFASYALFNYWLASYPTLTPLLIVCGIYVVYFLLLFPLLKLVDTVFPEYGYLTQFLLWMAYEYLKTVGFLGYPYGIMGYSQYSFLPLIQSASLAGIWIVSALVVFPSCLIGAGLKRGPRGFISFMAKHAPEAIAYGILFISALAFGFTSRADFSSSPRWRPALIQHDVDPWKMGSETYADYLERLERLSNQAIAEKPDVVIWSETAFVPMIDWHVRYRTDLEMFAIVERLLDYLKAQDVPFLIGNDDGRLEIDEDGVEARVDYNAAILFLKGERVQTYRKIHLVPFTEHFPYKKIFPHVYEALLKADTHIWKKGTDPTVFELGGVKFSTPICFEDVFGYLCREFVRQGADVLVNLTNDSWSNSVACERQHMTISIFRAVENRKSLVRTANGGITCAVDPNGRVFAQAIPFTAAYLIPEVPVYEGPETPYTKWGDYLGKSFAIAAAVCLLFCIARMVRNRAKGRD